jgi:hypothetical protein
MDKYFHREISNQFRGAIAHNVPAVYDDLAARIRALRSKDPGWHNVGEVERGVGGATSLAERNPEDL